MLFTHLCLLCVDQGRYLYCVPPADIFDPRYRGVIPMLRDGAFPLMSYEDILMSYYSTMPQYMTMQEEGVSKLLELKTAEMAKKLGLN